MAGVSGNQVPGESSDSEEREAQEVKRQSKDLAERSEEVIGELQGLLCETPGPPD